MFNISKALINAFINAFTPSTAPRRYAVLPTEPKQSRGKSGKSSYKPSGAASLKRQATKRNNIRKHK